MLCAIELDPPSPEPQRPPIVAPGRVVPRCRRCGYDLTGLRVEEACPECGASIWPSADELISWARREGKALSDCGWAAAAAVLLWFVFPPLGLLTNAAAMYWAFTAFRMSPGPGNRRRHRARLLVVLTMAELLVGLGWSWFWFAGVLTP